jgi:hypothetical protein
MIDLEIHHQQYCADGSSSNGRGESGNVNRSMVGSIWHVLTLSEVTMTLDAPASAKKLDLY